MLDITKIQKQIHKAIKDYSITSKYDEGVLVLFLLADIFREVNGMNAEHEQPKRNKKPSVVTDHETA